MSEQKKVVSNATAQGSLEKADLKDVLSQMQVDPKVGLSDAEAKKRLAEYGPNAITAKEEPMWLKFLKDFTGPIAYMIEAAAVVSAIIGHWDDFIIILCLLLFNACIELWQDRKASNALSALKKGLAPNATVLRDGQFKTIPASQLVPGDIVKTRLGQIVPADLRFTGGDYASIDQAALTGESLPVTKKIGDEAYSGSIVKQGEMTGVVIATGSHTFFGKTAKLVATAGGQSHAQKAMFKIGNFLIVVAVILALIMVAFRVYNDLTHGSFGLNTALNILQFVLVLLVASIPVAMPTVFSITLALGALNLSKKKAIVSKLSAIEEMAGVDILCSDKTGTLTKNQLTLGETTLIDAKDDQEVILIGSLASNKADNDPIDNAVISALKDQSQLQNWVVDKFIPFDPVSKRIEAHLHQKDTNEKLWVAKGAPQVIAQMAGTPDVEKKVKDVTAALAAKGYRALGVAESKDEGKTWTVLGVLSMFDPPRDDSKATIDECKREGISVKMITGDDTAIAIETAKKLGMGTNIYNASEVFPKDLDPNNVPDDLAKLIANADGFARVFPEHKYAIVKTLQKQGHIVAMTGDGVNDAPALKQADCGTAVAGATDAARSAAALILTSPGLSVIQTAITEARKIFARITSYTIYRVALTMNIMFLVVLSSIFLNFQPLTAVMIVIMSLLDDLPIMTIAYDNTYVSKRPIRWQMKKILTTSSILGVFAVIQSMLLLVVGFMAAKNPGSISFFNVTSFSQLQTIMFLQLVAGGHLLLFVTRQTRWFFERPFPAKALFWAIVITQIVAACVCYFGWLVPKISLARIGEIWLYNIIWMFVLNIIRMIIEKVQANGASAEK
ncbi:plasma-membrane proton-efflux P-type ATPase [Lactobacillus xujianguonis]|uniref:Plasma-membrane proton-efflux P-type ATPase n=1 Tax=Lactobacillus xujianguonis TaxID=2495899 RepID=A0A437SVS6_9LACO|nr:plasma-membrane proton-efflux P-type ATPase [Lactobacillus xujianguonis]RVU71034.1 plasma-membrane proton-efflux P-type ATPase [Lactobacillus xujianguonis]